MKKDPREFEKERLSWSRWKHAILEEYLRIMAAVLRQHRVICFVDGFAGPGKYQDNQDGSPLLAARHAEKLALNNETYKLKCINVELDANVFANLQNATQPFQEFVTNMNMGFGEAVPAILSQIGSFPTLFFLDPIGVKGLNWSLLEPIFSRGIDTEGSAITELLIRFHPNAIARMAGLIENLNQSGAAANVKTLLDIYNLNSLEEWKQITSTHGIDLPGLTEAYQERLREKFRYVVRIPIRKLEGQFKYFLIFATRSQKGVQVMNDVLYSVEGIRDKELTYQKQQLGGGTFAQPLEGFGLTSQEILLDDLNRLKQAVLKELETMRIGQRVRRDDLRARVALQPDLFGLFSGSHFTLVLGGQSRALKPPKSFDPIDPHLFKLESKVGGRGSAGDDKSYVRRLQ